MKKIISCIIAIAIMLSVVCVTAVDTTSQINTVYDAENRQITISGTFPEKHGVITVIVSKYDSSIMNNYDDLTELNISDNVVQMTTWDGIGSLVLKIASSADVGYYAVYCGAEGMDVASKVFYITDSIEQTSAINAFKTATAETIDAAITNYVLNKPLVDLDIGNTIYAENKTSVQVAFANCIADEVVRLQGLSPAGEFTFASISECYNKALALVDFSLSTDKVAKLNSYATLFGLSFAADGTTHKAEAVKLMFNQSEATDGKILSPSGFIKAFNKGVAICVINGSTRGTIKEKLLAYDDIIGIDAEAGYESAIESNLNSAMAFGAFTTTEKIAETFNTAVTANPKPSNSGNDIFGGGSAGGSGGGGFSGGGSGQTAVGRPITSSESDEKNVIIGSSFSDIAAYTWAHDAIKYLSDKGVIQGVGDKRYEPDRNIKREEYAKIMVEAFELKSNGEEKVFSDVVQDAWYFNYVSVAYQNSIITGITDTEFGAGKNVTRQDAAVILYRYLKASGYKFTENGTDFDDIDKCADYAKEAIRALKNSGLINGSGDNRFEPNDELNRAQAAVMVYNIINAKEAK